MKQVKDIARDSLLQGILDFENNFNKFLSQEVVPFMSEYELNDGFGIEDVLDNLISSAVQKVSEKLEISKDECWCAMEELENG